jgi:hypothetical protein
VFYTTGRLTSEMVIKSAQMGVAIVISRSGMTQMGQSIAAQLGLCAIARAGGLINRARRPTSSSACSAACGTCCATAASPRSRS